MEIFYLYLILTPIVLVLSVILISVPSFVTMYRMGRKKYFKQLKLLFQLKKKITSSYTIESSVNYAYKGVIVRTDNVKSFFFPIIETDKAWIIEQKNQSVFETLYITECVKVEDKWENNKIEFSYQECVYLVTLNNKFKKKLKEISKNNIPLNSIDELNDVINSEIKSLNRDNALKSIFNE